LPLYNLTTELVRLQDVEAISEAARVAASLMFNVTAAALWLADNGQRTLLAQPSRRRPAFLARDLAAGG
jgi:hypothetical protein